MSWLRKLITTFRDRGHHEGIAAEIEFHTRQRADDLVAQGVPPDEARRQAALLVGNPTALAEATRDRDVLVWLETFGKDLRFAARGLRRHQGFATAAILSLALGIGANTALFSLLDALMWKFLPVAQPDRLVYLGPLTYPAVDALRSNAHSLAGVLATGRLNPQIIEERGLQMSAAVQEVTAEYFETLGVTASRGRVFQPAEARRREEAVAVISDAWWRAHYQSNPDAIGAHFVYRNRDFVIAGIAPPAFRGVMLDSPGDIWLPIEQAEPPNSMLFSRGVWLETIGRLRPGATLAQASAEAAALTRRKIGAEAGGHGVSRLRGRFSQPLLVLECMVCLVLWIACANLANLMLARAASREREIAIRQAIGAGRVRLIRQLLTEALLLAAVGGAGAIAVAQWLSRALLRFLPPDAAPALTNLSFRLEPRVLIFTAGLALLTCLIFGLVPAVRATRSGGLRATGRSMSRGLVAAEVALCALLLFGAGLFVRSLRNLRQVDSGFLPERVLVASVGMPREMWRANPSPLLALQQRAAELPGVRAAGLSHIGLLSGFGLSQNIEIDGRLLAADEAREAYEMRATPGFLAAMGTPLLEGRDFTARDDAGSPAVAIVNQSFARRFFPGEPVIGRRFGRDGPGSSRAYQIIGVAKDTKLLRIREEAPAMFYLSFAQTPGVDGTLAIRARGDLRALASVVRQTARNLDARITLKDVVPFSDLVDRTLATERMVAQVSAGFGALALLVASVGLYGVLAWGVARRTREIGVRMALGASRAAVQWGVLRESLLLLAAGLLLGAPAAFALSRMIQSMLFGLTTSDPWTIGLSMVTLFGVTMAAGLIPARRASRVDPAIALRHE